MGKWVHEYLYDLEQNSPEWFAEKLGKFSASSASTLNPEGIGKGLKTLIVQKAKEKKYGEEARKHSHSSYATEHGHANEPEAIKNFEIVTGRATHDVGFIRVSEYFGVSPDFLVGEEDTGEIKSYQKKAHLKLVEYIDKHKTLPSKEFSQVQVALLGADRKGCWFIADYPEGGEVEKEMCFRHIYIPRDEERILYYTNKIKVVEDLIEWHADLLGQMDREVQCVGVMFNTESGKIYHYRIPDGTLVKEDDSIYIENKQGNVLLPVIEIVNKPLSLVPKQIEGVF
ncbi:MAG: hypothetical protein GY941_22395 [Planctomycetes bacterium]|nr:hypothetical protein [Planctomycetota bacterium]